MKAVMSIGNPLKSDDNIGNIILEKLNIENIIKIKGETTPENFIDKLKDYSKIVILDALQFGGEVGEIRVFELNEIKDSIISTHNIPISLLQKFFPDSEINIIGIQPKTVEFGDSLSEELQNKIEEIYKKIENLIIFL